MGILNGLEKMAFSVEVVFVHADLDPYLALDAQLQETILWGMTGFDEPQGVKSLRMVNGHCAGDHPVSLPHRICVATRAYASGRLTAVRLDDNEQFLIVEC